MVETPFSEQFDDIYFAREDGLAESRYVYLQQNNLPQGWQGKDRFVICETGFGTGLNFLSAWELFERSAESHQQLHYYSFEKFPLSAAQIVTYLGQWSSDFGGRLERLVDVYPVRVGGWHTLRVSPQVTLTVIFDDVNRALPELDEPVDCWFLDGHAPKKNPDMWSETVFRHVGRLSHKGSRVATFSAAGFIRRELRRVGFVAGKSRGFGFKCDMNVGVFEGDVPRPVSGYRVPKAVAIVGGGIAGAAVGRALAVRGCDVTVFERQGLASGGSGNIRGLCNPKFTAQRTQDADFYSPAFALAQRVFREMARNDDIGYVPCGSVHLVNDEAKAKRFAGFVENWGWHADHARLLRQDEVRDVSGVDIPLSALFLPDAAMVSPRLVVECLARSVQVVGEDVIGIYADGDGWLVNGRRFDAVVLAAAVAVKDFAPLAHLPLQKVRGQITQVAVPSAYHYLKTNLCYGGYASVAFGGEAVIGSTFQHWIDDGALRAEDDVENLEKLRVVAPQLADGATVIGARAGFRCAAKDRVPVIGVVEGQRGLYVSTAHGSHGILSSLMGAEFLASKICGEPQILPRSVTAFLSPSRFAV